MDVELTSENLATAKREMLNREESSRLRTDVIRRLRAKLNGDETTDEAANSDTQGELESDDQNQRDGEPDLKTQVLADIRRRREERKRKEGGNNPAPKKDHHHLEEYEEGELSDDEMTNVIHFDHSYFDDIPQESGDGMRPLTQPSPCHSKYMDHNEPSPYRTLTNNPETRPVTPPEQTKIVLKTPKKKPSPIKFPVVDEAQRKHVKQRINLRGKLDRMRAVNSTPNSPTPNCSESTPRRLWKQDDDDDVCTEDEDEAEIGSAEPSEEEDSKE